MTTSILFVGETKMVLFETSFEVANLFHIHMSKYDTPEGKQVDDKFWDEFYETLTLKQKEATIQKQETPVRHQL